MTLCKKIIQGVTLMSVPCIVLTLIWKVDSIKAFSSRLPKCLFNSITGYYCPACGNTRSTIALLHGDMLLSIRENAAIPFLFMLLLSFYIELIFSFFNKRIEIVPRSNVFLAICIIGFLLYYILRNILPSIAPI